ncbi:MAG: hypothetical protein ACREVN_04995 [Gammaproteobacteria bacterium]
MDKLIKERGTSMRIFAAIAALVCLSVPAGAFAELRTYDVDAKYRQEVYEALAGILETPPNLKGQVERLPTGQLLIEAAPETHKQIEAVLNEVAARQASAAPQVTLRYWAVLGSPNEEDAAGVPTILRDALDEIEATHGALGFRVLANATLMTESGQYGELEGYPLTVRQQTYAQGTALNAQIDIEFAYRGHFGNGEAPPSGFQATQPQSQDIELTTTLEAGDIVVLAENTIDGSELDGTMFYIVHWPGDR